MSLLRRFVEEGDQPAFSHLVKHLVHIAYSAAIARLGRDDLAKQPDEEKNG